MPFILLALVFVPVFLINLRHVTYRHIPLYSWGTVIAIVHICAGLVSIVLIPIAALVISAIIEITYRLMTDEERAHLTKRFDSENEQAERKVEAAQDQYEKLHMLCSFTVEDEYPYRIALKALDDAGIWYHVRNGLLTSVFIKPEDTERAESATGTHPQALTDGPSSAMTPGDAQGA